MRTLIIIHMVFAPFKLHKIVSCLQEKNSKHECNIIVEINDNNRINKSSIPKLLELLEREKIVHTNLKNVESPYELIFPLKLLYIGIINENFSIEKIIWFMIKCKLNLIFSVQVNENKVAYTLAINREDNEKDPLINVLARYLTELGDKLFYFAFATTQIRIEVTSGGNFISKAKLKREITHNWVFNFSSSEDKDVEEIIKQQGYNELEFPISILQNRKNTN